MSEFHVVVVELGAIEKHPNADSLSVTMVLGGYPCIIRTGEYNQGDKAVYVPVDALVPLSDARFAFLGQDREYARLKAKRLRGVFSMGLLVRAEPNWAVGQNVQELLGIKKWEPEERQHTGGECESDPGFMPVYTDIEGLRKYRHLLVAGEEVVLHEKLHGANGRFCYRDGRLWVGSHRQIKRRDPNSIWWKAAIMAGLEEKLALAPNMVFYGEVFGNVQDLKYNTQLGVRFFDVFDSLAGRFLDHDDLVSLLSRCGLDQVPVLYTGPWSEDLIAKYSNGCSTLAVHCREGFVVRPTRERWNLETQRTIFKMVGEDYLLRKTKD